LIGERILNNEILLKILDILEGIDNRITQVESSLENLSVDDHYYMAWGSDQQTIEELRKFIKGETK
jgi:hypothetical protein